MIIERLPYNQGDVVDFFEEGIGALGGLCSRSWHDRLEVVAEGDLARILKGGVDLHTCELTFVGSGTPGVRSAGTEVFPGCPITFAVCERLMRTDQNLSKVVLAAPRTLQAPTDEVAEKLWRAQHGDCRHWSLTAPFKKDWHFSLVVVARFEIQAIDQQWSLHRMAVSLPAGEVDDALARDLGRLDLHRDGGADIPWPGPQELQREGLLGPVIEQELAMALGAVRSRQALHLQRELARIDHYFQTYAADLRNRRTRSGSAKLDERLAAAEREHERHRQDQVARHEIVVRPHVDTCLLIAEPAYVATLSVTRGQQTRLQPARFVPRIRRWVSADPSAQETGLR